MALSEISRVKRKVAALAKTKAGGKRRLLGVEISIQRDTDGTFVGMACLRGKKTTLRKIWNRCSAAKNGATPSEVVRKTLAELAQKVR